MFEIFHFWYFSFDIRGGSFQAFEAELPPPTVPFAFSLRKNIITFAIFIIIISFYHHHHHHFLSSLLPLSSSSFLFITTFTIIIVIISYYHTIAMSYKINPHHHIISSSFLVICHKTMFALRTKISQSYTKFAYQSVLWVANNWKQIQRILY